MKRKTNKDIGVKSANLEGGLWSQGLRVCDRSHGEAVVPLLRQQRQRLDVDHARIAPIHQPVDVRGREPV